MSNKPKILITGATGQVGAGVIPHLAGNTSVQVVAAARSPEKAKHLGMAPVYRALHRVVRFFLYAPASGNPHAKESKTLLLASGEAVGQRLRDGVFDDGMT